MWSQNSLRLSVAVLSCLLLLLLRTEAQVGLLGSIGQQVTQHLGGASASNSSQGEAQNVNLVTNTISSLTALNGPYVSALDIPVEVLDQVLEAVGIIRATDVAIGPTDPATKQMVAFVRSAMVLSFAAYMDPSGFQAAVDMYGVNSNYTIKGFGFVSVDGFSYLSAGGVVELYDTQAYTVVFEDPSFIAYVFRGTQPSDPPGVGAIDVLSDIDAEPPVQYAGMGCTGGCTVSPGFQAAFQAVTTGSGNPSSDIMASMTQTYQNAYGTTPTDVTRVLMAGHSLGGALATLGALWAIDKYPSAVVSMINLGSPRVGNQAFASFFDSQLPAGRRYRVVDNRDIIPSVPTLILGLGYAHVCQDNGVIWFLRDNTTGYIQAKPYDRPLFYTGSLADHSSARYVEAADFVASHY